TRSRSPLRECAGSRSRVTAAAKKRSRDFASIAIACLPDSNLTEKRQMPADVFFDTNILLYLLSDDTVKADRAEALLANGGVISVQVLNEFAAVAVGKKAVVFSELKDILSAVRVACAVKPLDVETHELGLDIAERYQFSIYDGMIIAAALRA